MRRTISKAQWWQRVQWLRDIQNARRETSLAPAAKASAYVAAIVHRPVRPDFMRVTVD